MFRVVIERSPGCKFHDVELDGDMEEITENRKRQLDRAWSMFFWGVVGFAAGTLLAAPLILSRDFRTRVVGGMMFGGIPFTCIGAAYGARRNQPPCKRS